MKPETPRVETDANQARIAKVEAKAKAIIKAGLDVLVTSELEDGTGTSVSTCVVALTAELANVMGNLDRQAAAEVFELMGAAIRSGEAPSGAERERMIDAQKRLFLGDVARRARHECRGSA